MSRRCVVLTLSDGSTMRAPAGMTVDEAEALAAAARSFADSRCNAPSDVPLPEFARRGDRQTYTCGRRKDHDPPHRWPPDTGRIAEWTDSPTEEGTTHE